METIELPALPPRKPDSHKGDYGKILVIAGSENMPGAAAVTALAALRTGSGLVRIAAPKEILPHILTICPFATGFPVSSSRNKDLLAFADEHDVLAVGPGLGDTTSTKRLILELLERHHGPMVLDADALNALSTLENSEWPKRRNWGNIVLTPHMGEFMRLMSAIKKRGGGGMLEDQPRKDELEAKAKPEPRRVRSLVPDEDDSPSTADGVALDMEEAPSQKGKEAKNAAKALSASVPQSLSTSAEPDRTPLADLLSRGTGTIVVLKGHRTVITDGVRHAINTTGNPAMATAGSGDVLTGVIASLIGQKLSPVDAAVLAVHIHGLAGDLAAQSIGPVGLLATDIITHLPAALRTVIR